MKLFQSWIWVCVFTLVPGAFGQSPQDVVRGDSVEIATGQSEALSASAEVSVLRLVKLSGVIRDALGQPRTGVVGITFALYQEQEGGAPLWLETQNARLDEQGRYTVLLGAESSEGLPLEIFSSTEARWLGVTVQGEEEQPRVLLVSVPYALKSADAERLGGQLASSFVSRDPATGQLQAGGEVLQSSALTTGGGTSAVVVSGDAGFIAKFIAADQVGNSLLFESGGRVGVGTTGPGHKLHVGEAEGAVQPLTIRGFSNQPAGWKGGAAFGYTSASVIMGQLDGVAQIAGHNATLSGWADLLINSGAGNVGIGTTSPTAKLDVAGTGSGILATTSTTAFDTAAIRGVSSGGSGIVYGVRGNSASTSGTGVEGKASASSGFTFGVAGESASTDGIGVQGKATFATGNTIGVLGESASTGGIGVLGKSTGSSGNTVGVSGTANSGSGIGVSGTAGSLTGFTAGVSGRTDSTDGVGVKGEASTTSGAGFPVGVFGTTPSITGIGVSGNATALTGSTAGVFGKAASSSGVGVRGQATDAGGTAGVFDNDAGGNLIVGRVNFVTRFRVKGDGDVEIVPAGKGIIVKSPNGLLCKQIGIDNAGALTLTTVACP